jgi:hypothetical protein
MFAESSLNAILITDPGYNLGVSQNKQHFYGRTKVYLVSDV